MTDKKFAGKIKNLRSADRVKNLEVQRVIDLCLEGNSIQSILDVGTGSGLFSEAFSNHGLDVSGVDANQEMLIAARSYVPKGDFRRGTAEQLPFPDQSFDLSFLGLVLHETDDPLKALKEALRVSRKRVCILEWPYRNQLFGPPLAHRLKPEFLEKLVRSAGFKNWQTTELTNTILYRFESIAEVIMNKQNGNLAE